MAKFTSTLMGLTLVVACSATEANAGLFDWFGLTPAYSAPRVAAYPSNCGPNGCAPCTNGNCPSPSHSGAYGYNGYRNTAPVYTTTVPTTTYYGGSGIQPCTTGNCPTAPYTAPYRSTPVYNTTPTYNSTPVYNVTPTYNPAPSYNNGLGGSNPYYGSF